jgi:alpha-1,2-mannosyltransferase
MHAGRPAPRRAQLAVLAVGLVAFLGALAVYGVYLRTHPMTDWMDPVDLQVYRFGGLIAEHVRPYYDPRRGSPLYGWPGYEHLKFTYTPFAALVFTFLNVPGHTLLLILSVVVSILALVYAVWLAFGALGYRAGLARLGATLLVAAVAFGTEPIQRTLYLGQIELVLMALIMWDMCQPDRYRWKGVGVGLAGAINLVPLIFIPYLLLTRRFRQAAVAIGVFAATVAVGFLVLPADSQRYWVSGVFFQGSRTGFVGWAGNQSLDALITRLTGSVAGAQPGWLIAAVLTLAAGLVVAALLDRAGHRLAGILACALTGLLVSPVSWDHFWVWIAPAIAAAVGYGYGARGALRWAWGGLAVAIAGLFGAWPTGLWNEAPPVGGYMLGIIWAPPDTNPETYLHLGDRPWYAEYHWAGFQLVTGNLYLLAGMALLVLLAAAAVGLHRARSRAGQSGQWRPGGTTPLDPPQPPRAVTP